ncbi:alpha/beta hydrolase [Aquisphaera insulae]|uniref:alpha/beta hydrolase n=1 Tax=Aquisphaera insulae TaxID=2712864 RepID=UPI0013EBFC98|nr:alpha/beta hydrolase [Aquisphaera insulae]
MRSLTQVDPVEDTSGAESPSPAAARDVHPAGHRSRIRRLVIRGLRLLGLVILGMYAVLFQFQERLIFPGSDTQGKPEARVDARPGTELLTLKSKSGERVVALFGPALLPGGRPDPGAAARPALVFFYGNAMCLAYSDGEFERFRRLGLNVVIPDYLGFGMSGGKPSESGCRQAADAALDALNARGFPDSRIVVGGWSLGGAVAIDATARRPLAGVFAFSTFTSMRDMARTIIPRPLPVPGLLLRHKFDSLKKMPGLECPVLLGHGRLDPLAPFWMHEALAKAAARPVDTLVIEGAGHNDFFEGGGPRINAAVSKFLGEVFPARDERRESP